MDEHDIDAYINQSYQIIELNPQMDEENTKVKLIQPFLELLGWDLYSSEVVLEYTVPMASGNTRVDYALMLGDSPVVFVEAKPIHATLTDTELRQLRSYMRQELAVDWGILTNGESFEVLTKDRHQNGVKEMSVLTFNLDDLRIDPSFLSLLSKESIHSGKSDEVAEQIGRTNQAIQDLKTNEDQLTESIVASIESTVGDLPIDLTQQSREFVQNLVTLLHDQRRFVSHTTPSSESPILVSPSYDEDSTDSVGNLPASYDGDSHTINTGFEGYVIRFSDGAVVPDSESEPHTKQNMNMTAAVDYLITKYALTEQIEIPYFPSNARKNCLINTEPLHPNGDEMRGAYELVDGHYLHTALSTSGKQNNLRDLVDNIDMEIEFLGDW